MHIFERMQTEIQCSNNAFQEIKEREGPGGTFL
jgi:hypothetical protein